MKSYKVVMKVEKNKKGQGLSVGTLILIIIGVVVLVVLIFGFTMGWGNIRGWLFSSDNVEMVVSQCRVACASDKVYDYCTKTMELVDKDLENGKKDVTCGELQDDEMYRNYGVEKCEGVKCPLASGVVGGSS